MCEYALYHGDTFIDLGSKKKLASLLNVKEATITFYMTPTYLKRTGYRGYVVIRIPEVEFDTIEQENIKK